MKLENFKGNEKPIVALVAWLDEFFHSKNNKTKPFAVIHSRTGNGKTTLVKALADSYNVDLYRITTDDLAGIDDYNNCVKSLNLEKLEGKNGKIVLFEDFYEIRFFRNKIAELCLKDICRHPIIITMDRFPTTEELREGLIVGLHKPLTSDLVELLQSKQKEMGFNHDDSTLRQIAIDSPSVRSAINALYTGVAIKRYNPYPGILGKQKQLARRVIQQDLKREANKPYLLTTITNNINCYTDDGFKILSRLAVFDHAITTKFLTIDKFLVNNMKEPLEKIEWFTGKKKPKKERKPKNQKKSKPKPTKAEKPKPQLVPLADFE